MKDRKLLYVNIFHDLPIDLIQIRGYSDGVINSPRFVKSDSLHISPTQIPYKQGVFNGFIRV